MNTMDVIITDIVENIMMRENGRKLLLVEKIKLSLGYKVISILTVNIKTTRVERVAPVIFLLLHMLY